MESHQVNCGVRQGKDAEWQQTCLRHPWTG